MSTVYAVIAMIGIVVGVLLIALGMMIGSALQQWFVGAFGG